VPDGGRHLADLLEELVSDAPVGLCILDSELRFAYLNPWMTHNTGFAPEQLVGRSVDDVYGEVAGDVRADLERVRSTGEALLDRRVEWGDRTYSLSVFCLRSDDPGNAAVGIAALDVTERETRRTSERRALEDELAAERRLADTLQRALLPRHMPDVPGLRVAARYRAAGERFDVGGDFYDVFPSRRGTWFAVVGDVCGKGPEAAARTAMARYALRAEASHTASPERLLLMLNEELRREDPDGLFITLACAALKPGGDGVEVRLVLAGHPRPVLLEPGGGAQPIGERAAPVGVLDTPRFRETRALLAPGAALAIYTDGLLDAQAPARVLSEEDVAEAVAGLRAEGPESIAGGLEALLTAGGVPRDDCALLVLSSTAPRRLR
jgi:PAS domain S-box-containing protein